MSAATGDLRIRVRDVQTATANVLGVPLAAMRQPYGRFVRERQLAMTLAVEITGKTVPEVAQVFGCNHTTVLHAMMQAKRRLADCDRLRAKADRIRTESTVNAARFIETMRRAALPQANTGRSA